MRLIREARLRDLLPAGSPGRLEASGVIAVDGRYLVIFDNLRAVARIDADLSRVAANDLVPTVSGKSAGYEDIARDPITGHLFLLVESTPRNGGHQAMVEEYDQRLRPVTNGWMEYPLSRPNKGMEGLEFVRRDEGVRLLGLHESGGLLVFAPGARNWKHVATVDLPADLGLADYSGISLSGNRLALISQQSQKLWVGELAPDKWAATGPGHIFSFPYGYCTVEGVCWLGPDRIVVVSDRSKRGSQPRLCRDEEESLHLFDIASADGEDRAHERLE
ncbi:hypothetical protein [Paractinoplanes globisporus]|uniref:Uncharacterized protein n=1 Tax=Paractinoplanes globisporus TaxID=113565 RepID=A0ABW6WDF0_9ACTN|nr:hypothetical protein [Actinoplanes globisporus]